MDSNSELPNVTRDDSHAESPRYVVVSTDGHCGADVLDYKPYLEGRYLDEFDDWAKSYHDPWANFDSDVRDEFRLGVSSFAAPLNWESDRRLEYTEKQGISAELLFPNTAPPFFPSGILSAASPRTREEYDYRFAGLQAHNRWLVDFCNQAPGRRAGLAQIFLDDIDAAISEVRRAKAGGLMGVLLPNDHILKLNDLYYPQYDALWAVCAELQMPVHRHAVKPTEGPEAGGKGATWVGSFELGFFALRPIAHLICAGVFERFPDLKFVVTEAANTSTIPSYLSRLDRMFDSADERGLSESSIAPAASDLRRRPSEYFGTNCFVANPLDFVQAYQRGTPNMMWGSDLPHAEGTSPFTIEALRHLFSSLPEEVVRRILGLDAIDVYGFDRGLLQQVADRVGPSPAEIAQPLSENERPKYPDDTRCLAFASVDQQVYLDSAMR